MKKFGYECEYEEATIFGSKHEHYIFKFENGFLKKGGRYYG